MKRSVLALLLVALGAPVAAGELRTATLEVKGMVCPACPVTVSKALRRVPGVADAQVDAKTGTAEVTFDPDRTRPEDLARAVAGAGFPTTVRR